MPLFEVDVQKFDGTSYYWTNQYHVSADSYDAATTIANQIITLERKIHTTRVSYNACRIKEPGDPRGVSAIFPLSGFGEYTATGSDVLSYFNTARVDFNVHLGLPGRKYFRTLMDEAMIFGYDLSNGYVNDIQTMFVTPMVALSGLVSVHGADFVGGVVKREVQMRQQRRGSKRRVRPVI